MSVEERTCPECGGEMLAERDDEYCIDCIHNDRVMADGGQVDNPVNEVYVSESLKQLIVEECVICGETHRHGSKDRVVAEGGESHRVAHCNSVDGPTGYYLKLADDADRPERWLNYVGLAGDKI